MWIQFQEAIGRAILYMVGAGGLDIISGTNRVSFDTDGGLRVGTGGGGLGGGTDTLKVTNGGNIYMNLPTGNSGLAAGTLYKDESGFVKIS